MPALRRRRFDLPEGPYELGLFQVAMYDLKPCGLLGVALAHVMLQAVRVRDIGRRRRFAAFHGCASTFCRLFKGHLHAHLRKDTWIELIESDSHAHRRLLPIGCGHDVDDVTRDAPVWIGVEYGLGALTGLDPIDEGFVDVDFDLA